MSRTPQPSALTSLTSMTSRSQRSTPPPSVLRATVRALLQPTRLIPIVVVCATLLAAQARYSRDPYGFVLGVAMCLLFVLIAPVSWRVLFQDGFFFPGGLVRLALYASIGAGVILTLGVVIPMVTGMGATFLTDRYTLAVCGALFLVGGWGLGRDIGFEASLERERRRAAALAREAELSQLLALRSHLDPHFLFNTLNAIAEWCRQDAETAERAVLQLSSMLRGILAGVKAPTWSLERELELVRTLFALHLLRDPELFSLEWSTDPSLHDVRVPPMLLLPIVENAVKHGAALGHRGPLRFTVVADTVGSGGGERDAQLVLVEAENAGPYGGPREGSDGLPTLMKRLELAYDGQARFHIEGVGSRTRARLQLPAAGPQRETS